MSTTSQKTYFLATRTGQRSYGIGLVRKDHVEWGYKMPYAKNERPDSKMNFARCKRTEVDWLGQKTCLPKRILKGVWTLEESVGSSNCSTASLTSNIQPWKRPEPF